MQDEDFHVKSIIVCDQVRVENNGKEILIGVYGGDIAVQKFPVDLPLTYYLSFTTAQSFEKLKIAWRIATQSGNEIGIEGELFSGDSEQTYGAIHTPTLGMRFDEPDEIKIEVRLDEGDWRLLDTKRVISQQ